MYGQQRSAKWEKLSCGEKTRAIDLQIDAHEVDHLTTAYHMQLHSTNMREQNPMIVTTILLRRSSDQNSIINPNKESFQLNKLAILPITKKMYSIKLPENAMSV